MEKIICVEKRVKNSPRIYFNHSGNWLPRFIIWPEFDGQYRDEYEFNTLKHEKLFDEVVDRWGNIIYTTLNYFIEKYSLELLILDRNKTSIFQRLFSDTLYKWKRVQIDLTSEYINRRQVEGHQNPIFIMFKKPINKELIYNVLLLDLIDRDNLIPNCYGLFELGIEEAVLEICLLHNEDTFLEILAEVCKDYDFKIDQTNKHFLSHWIIANKERYQNEYGEDWDKF